jgi:outer membrane lipoprotein SlyB
LVWFLYHMSIDPNRMNPNNPPPTAIPRLAASVPPVLPAFLPVVIGDAVGAIMGAAVGAITGRWVGSCVGSMLGRTVGNEVGDRVETIAAMVAVWTDAPVAVETEVVNDGEVNALATEEEKAALVDEEVDDKDTVTSKLVVQV